jgi:dipeptidyl-peptidase 4
MKLLVSVLSVFLFPCIVCTQVRDSSLLDIDRIFKSAEFRTEQMGTVRWLDDGTHYLSTQPVAGTKGARDIVRVNAETGNTEVLIHADSLVPPGGGAPITFSSFSFSPDRRWLLLFANTKRVWRQNTRGDYWVIDTKTWSKRKIGRGSTPSSLMFAKFSPDGRKVGYVNEHNLYVEDVEGGGIVQLTRDGSPTLINGTFDWVYEEEFDLRDGFRWSPDGKRIAYWQIDDAGVPLFHLINNTDSLYPALTAIPYPKVGQRLPAYRIGIVSAEGGETRWLNVPGDPHNTYVARMDWAASSEEVFMQHLNRLQNTLTVLLGNADNGTTSTILVEHDSTWVDVVDNMQWLEKGKRFLWISERDGWRHAYSISRDGTDIRCLTPGTFDVIRPVICDEKAGLFYFLASPENAAQSYLYRVSLQGNGNPRRVTPDETGTHTYNIAPGCRWAVHTVSSMNVPPRMEMVHLPDHHAIRTPIDNAGLKSKLQSLLRGRVELIRVGIGNEVTLDGWRVLPPGFDTTKKYPVLVYVYGEPAGQTVVDRWGGSGHLWNLMLAQKGYVVVSFDNRGTAVPRGRAWRKSIYRQIGILASADQAAAVRAIRAWGFIDSGRVAVWGWSGGGSMSLNAILRYPEVYQTAMAVASVPDQTLYDAIYQERYMGLPDDNREGYRLGSPITFAENLKGNLLIVHGTGDDNVHYQGAERLINALIRANKQFTMMAYPNRSHGISEGENSTRHLYTLLTSYLISRLPPGPR